MKHDVSAKNPFQWLLDALQASAKRLHLGVPGPRNAELLELAALSVRGIAALPAFWRGHAPLDGSEFERGRALGRGECADSLEGAAAEMPQTGRSADAEAAPVEQPRALLAVLLRDAEDAHAYRVSQRRPEGATDDVMQRQYESLQARAQVRAIAACLRECAEFLPDRGLPGIAKDQARRALEGLPDLGATPAIPLASDDWIRVADRLPETGDMVEVRARAAFAELRLDGAPLAHMWECSASTISHWRVPQQEGEIA